MNVTPTKTSITRCFACFTTNPWRTFKHGSSKWTTSGIEQSLFFILGTKYNLSNQEVCEPCLKKITEYATFKQVLEGNIAKISRCLEQKKRQLEPPSNKKKQKTSSDTNENWAVPRSLFPSQANQDDADARQTNQKDAEPLASELPGAVAPFPHQKLVSKEVPTSQEESKDLGLLWNKGVQWDPRLQSKGSLEEKDVTAVVTNKALLLGVERRLLENLRASCVELTSLSKPSVLRTRKKVKDLEGENLVDDIIQEMQDRCPLLLDTLLTVATPEFKHPGKSMYAMIAMVYSMLMFNRSMQLSAMQRVMTIAAAKGGVCERYLTLQNKMRVTLCLQSKLNLMDECAQLNKETTASHLKSTRYCNVVGDNCDININTGNEATDNHDSDLHYFGLLLVFPRLGDCTGNLSTERPVVDVKALSPDMFVITTQAERLQILQSYKVLLGRILASNIPALHWMETILPKHIPHRFSDIMARKSTLVPTELVLLNEAKHEECVLIMDEIVKQVRGAYTHAFGGTEELEQLKVPVFGDQLTRIRLQHAKPLRIHAPSRVKKLEDIGPVMCTMWHNKQDLLEKAYSLLYDTNATKDAGTLYHFKLILQRKHVNGNVKSNYKAHEELFLLVGEHLLLEQALEYLGMPTYDDQPNSKMVSIPDNVSKLSREKKRVIADDILMGILNHYEHGVFTWDDQSKSRLNPPTSGVPTFTIVGKTPTGKLILKQKKLVEDQVMSYSNNLAQWCLQLMHLNDTAKEGDLDRMALGCKMNIPFFYSHSHLSKYLYENIDMLMKTEHTLSPLMRFRLLEGSYVNRQGGPGNNIETDLAMEHSIRNRKDAIRNLGANKTEKAMQRVSMAADMIDRVTESIYQQATVTPKSNRHTKRTSAVDRQKTKDTLRRLRPFAFRCGRVFTGQKPVPHSPFGKINKGAMKTEVLEKATRSHLQQMPGWHGRRPQQRALPRRVLRPMQP